MRNRQRSKRRDVSVFGLAIGVTWASIAGSISGLVTDPQRRCRFRSHRCGNGYANRRQNNRPTDAKGFYSLPAIDRHLRLAGESDWIQSFTQTGTVINANSALRVDATLSVGTINENVEVQN